MRQYRKVLSIHFTFGFSAHIYERDGQVERGLLTKAQPVQLNLACHENFSLHARYQTWMIQSNRTIGTRTKHTQYVIAVISRGHLRGCMYRLF